MPANGAVPVLTGYNLEPVRTGSTMSKYKTHLSDSRSNSEASEASQLNKIRRDKEFNFPLFHPTTRATYLGPRLRVFLQCGQHFLGHLLLLSSARVHGGHHIVLKGQDSLSESLSPHQELYIQLLVEIKELVGRLLSQPRHPDWLGTFSVSEISRNIKESL